MAFTRRTVALPAGGVLPYQESEWEDALVVVAQGLIELEGMSGRRWCFARGAMLWLTDLPLSAIHNPGADTAVLCAISRGPMNPKDSPRLPLT